MNLVYLAYENINPGERGNAMNVQQYILINVVLIAVFCVVCLLLKRKSTQEKKPPLCETCANLRQKRSRSISRYTYVCNCPHVPEAYFDNPPEYCTYYVTRNTK